jgi:hypothetical protein
MPRELENKMNATNPSDAELLNRYFYGGALILSDEQFAELLACLSHPLVTYRFRGVDEDHARDLPYWGA